MLPQNISALSGRQVKIPGNEYAFTETLDNKITQTLAWFYYYPARF